MRFVPLLLALLLTGCAALGPGNVYRDFYHPSNEKGDKEAPVAVEYLRPSEKPTVLDVEESKLNIAVRDYLGRSYIVLGKSGWSGPGVTNQSDWDQRRDMLISMAREVGATVVIHSYQLKSTSTQTHLQAVGTASSTFYSSPSGSYAGSGTTYGTQYIPITTQVGRYDVHAIFLAKYPHPGKFGAVLMPLTHELRMAAQRNTGVAINYVIEGKLAFYANLLPNDVVIEVNGKEVMDVKQAEILIAEALDASEKVHLKVIRNGKEIHINVPR